jgi:hypothetical protein
MKGMTSTWRRPAGGAVEPVGKQHVGVLDEADFDAPVGVAFAPLGGEMLDFLVAVAVARAVADQQDGSVVMSMGSPVGVPCVHFFRCAIRGLCGSGG